MYEDLSGMMHPFQETVQALNAVLNSEEFAYFDSILGLFGDQGPLDMSLNEEPIDNDETIEAMLAAQNL